MTAEELRSNAQLAIEWFSSLSELHEEFGYNSASVKWLDEFIENQRTTTPNRAILIQIIGSYLGECIIQTYGGTWKSSDGQWAVSFNDLNWVFPFAKVSKQFQYGHDGGDSIFSFFDLIGIVFFKGK